MPTRRTHPLRLILSALRQSLTLNAIVTFIPSVPNEPVTFPSLGETTPLEEDALVGYTFQQYLAGDGTDWPILLPMVNSSRFARWTPPNPSLRASPSRASVQDFIVTGAFKAGLDDLANAGRRYARRRDHSLCLRWPESSRAGRESARHIPRRHRGIPSNGDSTADEPYVATFDQLRHAARAKRDCKSSTH